MSVRMVSLDDIAESIVDGPFGSSLKTSDYVDVGVPVLQGKNITGDSFSWKDVRFITEKKAKELFRSNVKPGDHLLIKIGSIGYSAVVDSLNGHDFAIIPANLARIRPDRRLVDDRYLHSCLISGEVKRYFRSVASSTAQPALSLTKIKECKIPLPPLDEQKRIAAILDKADALRAKRRQAIALLDSLTQSIFLEMFGDPVSNPKGYPIRELQEIVDPERKITYGILMPGPDVPNGIPYVRVVDIQGGAVLTQQLRRTTKEIATEYRRSELKAGDLLISIRGHVGRMAIAPLECEGANITQDTARLAITAADPHFVCAVLAAGSSQHWMGRRTKGVAVRGINLGDLKRFPVILPPADLQRQFAAKVEHQGRLIKQSLAQATEAEALFASLQNRAFSGQL